MFYLCLILLTFSLSDPRMYGDNCKTALKPHIEYTVCIGYNCALALVHIAVTSHATCCNIKPYDNSKHIHFNRLRFKHCSWSRADKKNSSCTTFLHLPCNMSAIVCNAKITKVTRKSFFFCLFFATLATTSEGYFFNPILHSHFLLYTSGTAHPCL